MKRYILFSMPAPQVIEQIAPLLFPKQLKIKILAYMPSDGSDLKSNELYTPFWEDLARKHGVDKFNFLDNSSSDPKQKEKIEESNILLITGGNTFTLLDNLRKSGLDKQIIELSKKNNFVIAGFSAGAAVLTPTINIVGKPWSYGMDENKVRLEDLCGLSLVDFEVLPHFTKADIEPLDIYRSESNHEVRTISDLEYILIDKE